MKSAWKAGLALVLAAGCTAAQAAVILQTQDFLVSPGTLTTPFGFTGSIPGGAQTQVVSTDIAWPNESRTLQFSLFDPSLGTLNSVSWFARLSIAIGFEDTALVTGGQGTSVTIDMDSGVVAGAVLDVAGLRGTGGGRYETGADRHDFCQSFIPLGGSLGCTTGGVANGHEEDSLVASDLSSFYGTGQFQQELEAGFRSGTNVYVTAGIPGGPDVPIEVTGSMKTDYSLSGFLTLRYDFTPAAVSLPATPLLLALGLLALGAARRQSAGVASASRSRRAFSSPSTR